MPSPYLARWSCNAGGISSRRACVVTVCGRFGLAAPCLRVACPPRRVRVGDLSPSVTAWVGGTRWPPRTFNSPALWCTCQWAWLLAAPRRPLDRNAVWRRIISLLDLYRRGQQGHFRSVDLKANRGQMCLHYLSLSQARGAKESPTLAPSLYLVGAAPTVLGQK